MEYIIKTLGQVRKELKIKYKLTVINYGKTYDIQYQTKKYCVKPMLNVVQGSHYIGDTQEITKELYNLLLSEKDLIREFEKDYYRWKSPKDISIVICVELDLVLKKLNEKKFIRIWDLKEVNRNINNMENNVIVENTTLNQVSSYQILKQIQLDKRYSRIKNSIR